MNERKYSGNQKLARQGCQIHERSIISRNDWRPWCVCAQRALLIISFSSSIAVWLLLHWRSIITEENLSTQENELWKIEQG